MNGLYLNQVFTYFNGKALMNTSWYLWLPYSVAALLFVLELFRGCYSSRAMPWREKLLNGLSLLQDSILIRPVIAYTGATALAVLLPDHAGLGAGLPFWPALLVILFGQDLIHYWFHRWAHHNPWLWQVHRTHHSAKAMSLAVTPRLNMLWEIILPINWISVLVIYAGMDEVYWAWFGFRALVNFLSHSHLRWDLALYKIRLLQPLVWVFERVVTTPDAHHAHHGTGINGSPLGNFAPTIIFWDVVFGTASFPHARQEQVGIAGEADLPWYRQLWWPLFK
jgi:sterol desaturase/sphingolipid hydroxylase (fatty acid hydroxylase superfamily)